MSKFDALSLAVDQATKMPIINPINSQPLRDKDNKEAYLMLLSVDSEASRKHDRVIRNRRLARRVPGKMTAEEIDAENVETLIVLTTGWHLVDFDGNVLDVPFSPEAARDLYSTPSMSWLRKQAQEWIGTDANFAKASSTDS